MGGSDGPTTKEGTMKTRNAGRMYAAIAAMVMTVGVFATASSALADTYHSRPRWEGYRIDWCESWGKNCGKRAADRFCSLENGAGSTASSYRMDVNVGRYVPTRTMRSPKVCSESFCDSFQYIRCRPPVRPQNDQGCRFLKKKTLGIGNKTYVRGELQGQAEVNRPTSFKYAEVSGKLRGCFAGHCATLAEAAAKGRSYNDHSELYLKAAGKTVKHYKLKNSGGRDYGPYVLKAKIGHKFPIVPGVSIGAKATFGAGVEIHTSYNIRRSRPFRADLGGTAKTFANGTGEVSADLLYGVAGSASVEGTMELPSPDVIGQLNTNACNLRADARVELKPWKLKVKAKGKVGCIPWTSICIWKDSKTLYDRAGSKRTYPLF